MLATATSDSSATSRFTISRVGRASTWIRACGALSINLAMARGAHCQAVIALDSLRSVARPQVLGHVLRPPHSAVHTLDLLVQRVGLGRGHQTPLAALEQGDTQAQFQQPQQSAGAGLRHLQQGRRVGGHARHHHSPKHLDLAQVDRRCSPPGHHATAWNSKRPYDPQKASAPVAKAGAAPVLLVAPSTNPAPQPG